MALMTRMYPDSGEKAPPALLPEHRHGKTGGFPFTCRDHQRCAAGGILRNLPSPQRVVEAVQHFRQPLMPARIVHLYPVAPRQSLPLPGADIVRDRKAGKRQVHPALPRPLRVPVPEQTAVQPAARGHAGALLCSCCGVPGMYHGSGIGLKNRTSACFLPKA